jgi:DNA-binding MarR family transcriptional regulator
MDLRDDEIDHVLADWATERPDLHLGALGIALRLQLIAKLLSDQVTKELADAALEWWEYDVISALRRQGQPFRMAATEIAQSTRLSPGAMTNRIDRLQKKALVKRVEDETDRRRVLVELTQKGLKAIDQATEARFACADQALRHLGSNEREGLDALLRKLVRSNSDTAES